MTAKSGKKSKSGEPPDGFSDVERAAIKERAAELKASGKRAAGERDVLAKIAELPQPDRAIAERVHAIVTEAAPQLQPKPWYGAPAYYLDGKPIVFFRSGQKDNERYSTLGFGERANLDDGNVWPTAYAVTELSKSDEATIRALVKKAVS